MKLLHTADWHLGRFLHGQNLLEDQKVLLDQILKIIINHEVDALLIAGDIYDRAIPPKEAVVVLNNFIESLTELNVPLIMISGNHDSSERLDFASELLRKSELYILADLENVTAPVELKKNGISVNIYGIPFASPEVVRDEFNLEVKSFDDAHTFLVNKITESMDTTKNNVLMSHCFVDGASESDSEKTLSIGGSDRVSFEPMLNFDYVALGHLHSPQKRREEYIRYSGSIAKYSFSEHLHKKGVTLLEFNQDGLKEFQTLELRPKRDARIIEGLLSDIIEQGKTDPNSEDYIMVRLKDETALLDPMAKLREVYPNTLHMEKPQFQTEQLQAPSKKHLDKEPFQMVEQFYQQSTGENLSTKQQAILCDLFKTLQKDA